MKVHVSFSKLLALGVLTIDAAATFVVLDFCRMSILRDFTGPLPYLTTLIGALQASTAVVLGAYFQKARAENTKGGIIYDAALAAPDDPDGAV